MSVIPNVKLENAGPTDLVVTSFNGRKKNETIDFPAGEAVQLVVDAGQSLRIMTKPKAISKAKDAPAQPES